MLLPCEVGSVIGTNEIIKLRPCLDRRNWLPYWTAWKLSDDRLVQSAGVANIVRWTNGSLRFHAVDVESLQNLYVVRGYLFDNMFCPIMEQDLNISLSAGDTFKLDFTIEGDNLSMLTEKELVKCQQIYRYGNTNSNPYWQSIVSKYGLDNFQRQ